MTNVVVWPMMGEAIANGHSVHVFRGMTCMQLALDNIIGPRAS